MSAFLSFRTEPSGRMGAVTVSFSGRRKAGLTLIETLMVVGMIGVLIGLLLPAVQSAREGARANQCRNNLSQLWVATHTYHDAFNVFPAGTLSGQTPVRAFPEDYHHSWLVRLRGEMSDGTIFTDKIDWTQSVYAPVNWKLGQDFYVGILSCPSSWIGGWDDVATNYAAVHDGRVVPIEDSNRGAFIPNRFLRRQDFADGLSTMLFLSEKRVTEEELPDLSWLSGTRATLRTTGIPLDFSRSNSGRSWGAAASGMTVSVPYGGFREQNPQTYEEFIEAVNADPAIDTDWLDGAEWEAFLERMEATSAPTASTESEEDGEMESAEPDLDSSSPSYGDESGFFAGGYGQGYYGGPEYPAPQIGPAGIEPRGLGSYHQNVINGVMGDGRVVVISATIDGALFAGMGIRDDGVPLVLPRHVRH